MAVNRVVVTGIGICSPLGVGVQHVWNKLLQSGSGIVSTNDLPDSERYDSIPCKVVGIVPKGTGTGELNESDIVSTSERRTMSLNCVYALAAAKEVLECSNFLDTISASHSSRHRTGVCIGTGMVDLEEIVQTGTMLNTGLYKKISPYFIPRILPNMAAGHVSIRYGLEGPNLSPSTACTTGLHAIGDSYRLIQRGDVDAMVCGGTEASVTPLGLAGFCKAKALSTKFNDEPQKASRPFDIKRDGFIMGEGAAVLLLESFDHALERKAEIYCEILGYGLSGDAHHLTAPEDSGRGAIACMKAALDDAKLEPDKVSYINAHATSTPLGDRVESAAVKKLFGSHSSVLSVSSTKGATGHLLGAAGSLEAAFTVLAVKYGVMPPTLNVESTETEMDLDYVPQVSKQWDNCTNRIALTNSYGFGGTNASLCISQITSI
ncbi:3-oxoacyl-[acyl-carrier-protein] synthase, mitochondrial-like [Dysidea avara]|uniref:3-oxoacyl-[acyl-carrier-protein] synthase, mitochondrial-like n=1 Tax=Dysidea avara TaxID=196820 RepID=UPI00332C3C7B